MDEDLEELVAWIEKTRQEALTLCQKLHFDTDDIKEWTKPTDQTFCTVCNLQVPQKTYAQHLNMCQVKKLLPRPKLFGKELVIMNKSCCGSQHSVHQLKQCSILQPSSFGCNFQAN